MLNHFYTSNLIINNFGSDLIPIKLNASRVSNYTRLDLLEKLIDSILNDIKLKENEELARSKGPSESESLSFAYSELMKERNEIVEKHNELVKELDELYLVGYSLRPFAHNPECNVFCNYSLVKNLASDFPTTTGDCCILDLDKRQTDFF